MIVRKSYNVKYVLKIVNYVIYFTQLYVAASLGLIKTLIRSKIKVRLKLFTFIIDEKCPTDGGEFL